MTKWHRCKFTVLTNGLSMIGMNTKVTIGLCVKNGARIVKTAFDSISIQDYSHDLIKLVIVDDGSSDNTLSLAMEFAQKTDIPTLVTSNKGKGLGAARQTVIDNAEGDYIVWVDDDLVLTKNFVRNLVEFMEKNPTVGGAKGFWVEYSTQHVINIINFVFLIPSQRFQNQKAIGAGGSIFRLKALEKIGGFDVRIKGAGEDQDISRRVRESGWTLAVVNSAGVYQKYVPTTLKTLWKKNFGYGYGNHFLFHKYKDKHSVIQYFPPFALLAGLRMTRMIYRVTNMKKVFVFFIIHSFSMLAQSFGFARAHLDEYGHVNGNLA
jgi:glycosyltransferase involved in cell wall biosynthesis